jgi:hypothetical protein
VSLTKTHTRSFAGGEITPELYGRIDLTKRQTGLAKALNFWTLPHGPVQNRPGFAYVLEAHDSTKKTRVIKFEFSTTQTYILEFGPSYIRFHLNGGTLVEAGTNISGITQANPGVATSAAHGYSNGQVLFLSGIGGMTQLNGRFVKVTGVTANTYQIQDLGGANINTTGYGVYTAGGTAARVYEVTTTYAEADLFDLHYTQSADVLTIAHPSYPTAELRRLGATSWALTNVSFVPTIATPTAPGAVIGGPGGGTAVTHTYVTTAVAADALEESLPSPATTSAAIDLTVAGNFVDVSTATVAGAVRYNVYKLFNGLYGYIGQTDGSTFRDNNVTPDVSKTPPMLNDPISTANNYPGAVGYAEQRRVFGGTNNKPQNYWLTRSGSESNLSYSIPTRDDDQIAGRILSRDVQRIRHIVALDILIMLTSGGEWKLVSQNSDILTPASAAPKAISSEGASNVQPVITGNAIVYGADQGGRVRDMRYKTDTGTFVATYLSSDISLMAPHLFDGFDIVDMAYTKAPVKIVWCVRSDGVLLGVTYLPEHDVIAWHQHTTDGTFESVAAVREGRESALYCVVKRNVNGRDVRYIERLHTRQFTQQQDAFFVDCGATYSGAPTTTMTGLWHLEGKTVSILADGAVVGTQAVTNGTVTLDQAASTIHVGLPITADLQTLPLAIENATAFGQGSRKNPNQVYLRVKDSSGVTAGPNFSKLREYKQRTNEPYGSPPRLINDEIQITIDNQWDANAQICIRQTQPLPVTISAMTLEVAIGG